MGAEHSAVDRVLLKVSHVDVFYGDVQVVWDASLQVGAGRIVTILGPNGAGKTSTLKAISGVVTGVRGTVEFDGHLASRLPAYRMAELGIAHVPEGRRVFPQLTVLENLEMGAYVRHARSRRAERLEMVFSLFPRLAERRLQLAGSMSGGEQQMLAIGRGLMSDPKLLILDEPSLGLMPILVESLFETIGSINRRGVTVLLVEQHVEDALAIAHHAYIMEAGRIVMEGTSRELMGREEIRRAYLGI